MNDEPGQVRNVPAFDIAFLAVIAAAYTGIFTNSRPGTTSADLVILVVLGVVITVVGLRSFTFFARHEEPLPRLLYFSIEVGLAALILYFSHGAGALIILPLAGE